MDDALQHVIGVLGWTVSLLVRGPVSGSLDACIASLACGCKRDGYNSSICSEQSEL